MTTATAPAPGKELVIAADIRAITQELAEVFVERRTPIEVIMIGILAAVHTFLLGPPGTAKSSLIAALCQRFPGSQFFRVLMNKQLPLDDLFGAIDIEAYEKGDGWIRDYQRTAATAHLAFFDEVGKSGPAALNPLLTLWEERMHKPGKVWEPAPLLSAIGASNEIIESDPELQAIWDRFLLRLEIDYIQDPGNFIKLLKSKVATRGVSALSATSNKQTLVPLDDLTWVINDVVPYIEVPDGIWDRMVTLRGKLREDQIVPSDRRWAMSVRVLQASAFFNGRDKVDDDDLLMLRYILWNLTNQRQKVTEEVMALGSPVTRAAMTLTASLDALETDIASHHGESRQQKSQYGGNASYEANKVEEELDKALKEARDAGRSTAPLEGVEAQLKNVRFQILVEYLGMNADRARAQLGIN